MRLKGKVKTTYYGSQSVRAIDILTEPSVRKSITDANAHAYKAGPPRLTVEYMNVTYKCGCVDSNVREASPACPVHIQKIKRIERITEYLD